MDLEKWEVVLTLAAASIAHQAFRRYDTYYPSVHAVLLLAPPLVAALVASSWSDSPAPGFIPIIFLRYIIGLGTSIILYRLSPVHPLSRYPGPYLRRSSHFVSACIAVAGNRCRHFDALRRRYGDIVRTGPNELLTTDPSLIPALLGPSGAPKGPGWIGGSLTYKNLPMVGIPDPELHLRRRRPWTRGLGPGALKEYEVIVAKRARQLAERLQEQSGEVVLGRWLNYFGYDFMSDMAFGGGSELLRDGDRNNVWGIIDDGMRIATFLGHVPWLSIYIGYIPGAAGPLNKLLASGAAFARKRVARGSQTRDLFHYLNNEDLPNKEAPTTRQLIDDGILAVVAGSDTTSVALTNIFFCVLTHPEVYATLQAEIDMYYPPGEDAYSTKDHRNMPYLQAVINEALRLYPPVPGGGERRVPHDSPPVVIGSVRIPPGTAYWMPPWCLQRDARNFTSPLSFWPERWLIASGHLDLSDARLPSSHSPCYSSSGTEKAIIGQDVEPEFIHNELAYIPFSYGPMNCAGKGLAMLEMRTVVTGLLQKFEMRLREGWDASLFERGYKDYFNATRPDLPVELRPRW
ncbi:high nitrogen upregulated cytochrome P450 monooxygenase 2 [Lentinus tigrinus ALCF2SS1-7]|uniref:High nitrogen upregulated cytochrome P450 monooxygenase 2 n=1 Tax=Lentinus tigrinus ALCF2SS1-6 TaxID=1328759 RepID=A0A5C2RR83_9APHY|nr:high nitrogen upregulated cytochrome P450 monooxygenase 2 [Lentinus tigrinus ALCF2SS1-6]RPD68211.1 high nitrogen upregulated cytochrome P450 monooxygenase 2 [Lentinus tigrinus ALCF2SS1-7]